MYGNPVSVSEHTSSPLAKQAIWLCFDAIAVPERYTVTILCIIELVALLGADQSRALGPRESSRSQRSVGCTTTTNEELPDRTERSMMLRAPRHDPLTWPSCPQTEDQAPKPPSPSPPTMHQHPNGTPNWPPTLSD